MPRINPWSYPSAAPRVVPVPFTDPGDPKTECVIYLREPGIDERIAAGELAEQYFADWGPKGEGFPSPNGQEVKVSLGLCRTIANLEVAQCTANGADLDEESPDRYNNLGMAGFLIVRALKPVGLKLTTAYGELISGGAATEGNSSTDLGDS